MASLQEISIKATENITTVPASKIDYLKPIALAATGDSPIPGLVLRHLGRLEQKFRLIGKSDTQLRFHAIDLDVDLDAFNLSSGIIPPYDVTTARYIERKGSQMIHTHEVKGRDGNLRNQVLASIEVKYAATESQVVTQAARTLAGRTSIPTRPHFQNKI